MRRLRGGSTAPLEAIPVRCQEWKESIWRSLMDDEKGSEQGESHDQQEDVSTSSICRRLYDVSCFFTLYPER